MYNCIPHLVNALLRQARMQRGKGAPQAEVESSTDENNVPCEHDHEQTGRAKPRSPDSTLLRECAPTWMRRDYWQGLCDIWAAERWQETFTIMKLNRAANPKANKHTSGSVSFATHQSRLKKELKRPPTFQEVFDKTHKKKGTDQYISDRALEVAAGEEEEPQLDLKVWVAASGAPKKGHVYGFGHSMDTIRVLSGASSSSTVATSAFTTPGAPGTSPNEMMGFIRDEISSLESHLAHTMHMQVSDIVQAQLSQAISQAISQALSQVSIPPQAAPSTSAWASH
ncbi:hypothetical protein Taro_056254, partial [Colocasia esculenta]|nr:hypothetical protein [Colocasia esculenta]